MPGAQLRMSRLGSWTEVLVEACLKAIAFTARVPREEDIGHDFFCVLSKVQDELYRAGPSFTVQAKSNADPLVFGKKHQVEWLKELQNPHFLVVADREKLCIDIYSTWARFNGFLRETAEKIVLQPGPPTDNRSNPWTAEDKSKQIVALGKPIISAALKEFMDERRAIRFRDILWQWIALDRRNIVNAENGLHWIVGPKDYRTNELLSRGEAIVWTYYNAQNLKRCRLNFDRAATLLRVTLGQVLVGCEKSGDGKLRAEAEALDQVLRSFWDRLEPVSRDALGKFVQLTPGKILPG